MEQTGILEEITVKYELDSTRDIWLGTYQVKQQYRDGDDWSFPLVYCCLT